MQQTSDCYYKKESLCPEVKGMGLWQSTGYWRLWWGPSATIGAQKEDTTVLPPGTTLLKASARRSGLISLNWLISFFLSPSMLWDLFGDTADYESFFQKDTPYHWPCSTLCLIGITHREMHGCGLKSPVFQQFISGSWDTTFYMAVMADRQKTEESHRDSRW